MDLPVPPKVEAVLEEKLAPFRESILDHPPWQSPWFMLGAGMLVAAAVGLGFLWLADRTQGIAVAVAIGAMFIAGKESSLPIVLFSLSGNPLIIAFSLIWVDAGASIALYPFIAVGVAGVEHSKGAIWGFVGGVVRSTHRRAAKKREMLDKYGGYGLWAFMIVPFAFNGPPVGMVLGRIVGLHTRTILAAVVAAILATTIAWTVAWRILWDQGVTKLPVPWWVPATLAVAIAAFAISWTVVEGIREHRREKAAADSKKSD
ncbi:MAG: hypothetical protein V4510_02720 [bacterium]